MAYESFPNNAHNNRNITLREHELIVSPLGLSGMLFWSGTTPAFADSTGRHVKLRSGVYASIRGTRFNNEGELIIPIAANTSGKTRVDLVVLRLRRQESSLGANDQYTIVPHVILGVPADNPVAPNPLRDTGSSGFFDVPLTRVTVPNNAVSIAPGQVHSQAVYITGSGYTGREDWAFPPVEPGVLFRANDTGKTYIGTSGGTWLVLGEDTGWVNCAVEPGWSTAPTGRCRVKRKNGNVTLAVDLFRTGASISGGAVVSVAKLPAGFAPDALVLDQGAVTTDGGTARFGIDTGGLIRIEYYSPIATGRAISIQTNWPAA